MSSPHPPHTVVVEAFIDGAWTAATGDNYQREPITISRGASSESGRIEPGQAGLQLDNRTRIYSPHNASSTLYGKFRQGCPLRVTAGGQLRCVHEISAVQPRADQSGRDLYVDVQAAGLLQRLGEGADPVRSVPRTRIPLGSPQHYWPLEEDGSLAAQGEPAVGSTVFTHLGTHPQGWGQGTLADWLPRGLQGRVRSAISNDAQFIAPITPAGFATDWTLDYYVSGRADHYAEVSHDVDPFGTNGWGLSITPSVNSLTVTPPAGSTGGGAIAYIADGLFHHVRFQVIENFIGDANFFVWIDGVVVHSGNVTATAPQPVIDPLRLRFDLNETNTNDSTGVTVGHVAFWLNASAPALATQLQVARGNPGELAGDRINRLCTENGITLATTGSLSDTPPCGPQHVGTLLELLEEAAAVDGGFLREDRSELRLVYQTRRTLYNAAVVLALDHAVNHHLAQPLAPPDDTQRVVNDVTITRRLGGESRVEKTTGALGTSAYPAGIGRYPGSDTLNVLFQSTALDHAGWRVHVGTWGEARHPLIRLDLNTLPLTQRANALVLDPGERITISNPPAHIGADQIDLLIIGIRERVSRFVWEMDLICVPYGPYRVGTWEALRFSTDGSTVTASSGATSWSVATATGPLWITGVVNFDLRVGGIAGAGGERVTVTNISGASSPQTFTVTRSVNGVVRSHTNATVELWDRGAWALG